MDKRIRIGLEYKGHQENYSVPTAVTMEDLIELMQHAVKGSALPKAWTLGLKDKPIKVAPTDWINELPIGSGDVFCIVPLEDKMEKEKVNESI